MLIKVLLSDSLRAGYDEFDPSTFKAEAEFSFEAPVVVDSLDSALMACEIAFAVLNSSPAGVHEGYSYPAELHCDAKYLPVVEAYRAAKNRSLSVGDLVIIGETAFRCESMGFKAVTIDGASFLAKGDDGLALYVGSFS
jgi:hypothetical protein